MTALRSFLKAGVPVVAVMPERVVVLRMGEDLGSGECFVHDRPQNAPVSPNAPRKYQLSEINELTGAGEVDGARQRAYAARKPAAGRQDA